MRNLSWPHVAAGSVAALAFCGIFYMSDTTMRLALVGVVSGIGTAVSTVITTRRISEVRAEQIKQTNEIERVKEHVNGNTRRLIDKIPDAERPVEVPQV